MAQLNITITEELLHGLFLSNGRDEAFSKLLDEIQLDTFSSIYRAIGAEPYERTGRKSRIPQWVSR